MNGDPLFSVVIPAYNRGSTIAAALESVFKQSFSNYEIIVVDDGSTDDTVAIANSFVTNAPRLLRVLTQGNAGPGAARNTGIRNATGKYVALLDSDDLWFPWSLQNFQRVISEYGQPNFLCGIPVDHRLGEPVPVVTDRSPVVEQYADFFSVPGNPFYRFTTSGVVISRLSLEKVNGFGAGGFEDLDLWMRLGIEPGFALITDPPVVLRRLLGGNLSASREYNRSGTGFMIASEKSGRYPGGTQRKTDRRRLLGVLMRAQSMVMIQTRDFSAAWAVYFGIFGWSFSARRFQYLLGFPVKLLAGLFRQRSN